MPNEQIEVYAFIGLSGQEQEFTTIDPKVAVERADKYGLDIVVRVYEYKYSRKAGHDKRGRKLKSS